MTSNLVSKIDTMIYWHRQGVTFLGIHVPPDVKSSQYFDYTAVYPMCG
jgi:hypothetical protein